MDDGSRQNPAYRATLKKGEWAGAISPPIFLRLASTSFYTTCRRLSRFYGKFMGIGGQFHGQFLIMILTHSYYIPLSLGLH